MVYAERNMVFGKMLAQLVTAKSRFEVIYDKERCSEDVQTLLWRATDEDVCGDTTYPASFVKEFAYNDMSIMQIANEIIAKLEASIAEHYVIAVDMKETLDRLRIAILYKDEYVKENEENEFAVVIVSEDEDEYEDTKDDGLFATVVLFKEDGSDYDIVTKETVEEWGINKGIIEKIAFINSENEEYLVDAVYMNRDTIEFLDDLEDYAEDLLGLDDEEKTEDDNSSDNSKESQKDED